MQKRLSISLTICLLALLGACQSSTKSDLSGPPRETASVQTTTLLTGSAARVIAGPVGSPQDEASLAAYGIQPWGPVQKVHNVTIGNQAWVVNELSSPDPFTHTYQLPGGKI